MTRFRLAECTGPARALCTGFLLTLALGFLVAVLEVHATMGGVGPEAIASGIRGDAAETVSEFAEEFGAADDGLVFAKSYGDMLQTAHTHSFAMPLLFFAVGILFLGTDVGDPLKTVLLTATFASVVLDLGVLWLIRYVSPAFAYGSMATGTLLCACAAALIGRCLWDLWLPGRP